MYLKFGKCRSYDWIHGNLLEMTKWRNVDKKTLFGFLEMHYTYVLAYPWFYLFCVPMALSMCYLSWYIQNFCSELASKSVEIVHASLYHWSLKNKVSLDLSSYFWKSLVGDTSCCNFLLTSNCSTIVPETWYNTKFCKFKSVILSDELRSRPRK